MKDDSCYGFSHPKTPAWQATEDRARRNTGKLFFFPFPLSTTTEMCKEYKVCAVYTQPPSLFFPSFQSKLSCWEAATGQQDTEPSFLFLLVQIDLSSTFPISFPLFWSIVKEFLVRPCLFGWLVEPASLAVAPTASLGPEVHISLGLLNCPGLSQLLIDSRVINVQLICFMGYGWVIPMYSTNGLIAVTETTQLSRAPHPTKPKPPTIRPCWR